MHITLFEFEERIPHSFKEHLETYYRTEILSSIDEAIASSIAGETDLFIIAHSSEGHTFRLIEEIRRYHPIIPIVLISNDDSDEIVEKAFRLGTNDVVSRPITSLEFAARIRNKLQTYRPVSQVQNCFKLNRKAKTLEFKNFKATFSKSEFMILLVLNALKDKVVSRDVLMQTFAWDADMTNNSLRMHIFNIRRKMHPYSAHLRTVRSNGYILTSRCEVQIEI